MRSAQKILILGANGMLGARLREACSARSVPCVALSRAECDLAMLDEKMLRNIFDEHAPTHLINAAAYTAVDKAEMERDLAFAINAHAPRVMAEMTRASGVLFTHFSTDYVFDGAHGAPYAEDAATRPINVYGASKLAGEQAALAAGGIVFRVQLLYDVRGTNFFLRMLELLATKPDLTVVADQLAAPTFTKHIASAVLDGLHLPAGLYHMAAQGFTSRQGFACAIRAAMKLPAAQHIVPISSKEYPMPATRPLDTRLNLDKLAAHGITLPHWTMGLSEAMKELDATA